MQILTPRWALPLLAPARYKGAKGGRASGKSQFMAEYVVEAMVRDADCQVVCIREIQKSLRFSAKKLIEDIIRRQKVSGLFEILNTEIRRKNGTGIIIFQGMQDHTADSIKSLEGFDIAWCEEAQSLSARSIELLLPTIRKDTSEILFSWNPNKKTDAIERLFSERDDAICVHVNYTDNPWCPRVMRDEAERMARSSPERYAHIWLGGFNEHSAAQVFSGRYSIDEFEPAPHWDGPYFGLDFGFSSDPTAAVKAWINDGNLWIERDVSQIGLDIDKTAAEVLKVMPDAAEHAIRADNARPESISYLKRNGLPKITACVKGKGSVEDGVEFIKSFDKVIIHPRCEATAAEFEAYSYKIDKLSGDVMPVLIDDFNHIIDALRYALEPIMKNRKAIAPLSMSFSMDVSV